MIYLSASNRLGRSLLALLLCLGALTQAAAAMAQPQAKTPAEFWDALQRDDVGRVQTLLLRGVDTNASHPEWGPAIAAAAREQAWKTLGLLAGLAGTRVDAPNRLGETALMLAALHGHAGSVKLLIRRGAEVNRPGWAPLHYAASSGHADVVAYLLEQHAYIDAQSPNRTTPLMMAARHGHREVVRQLVEAGADPTARNEAGLDAAGYLQRHGDDALAIWLRERAADYERRYGTPGQPRAVEAIRAQERGPQRPDASRLPGMRD